MARYEIEQYELHVSKFRVEAASESEAVAKLFDGAGEAIDNSLEFIEVAEDFGLPVEEYQELAEELRKGGIAIGDDVIPSIRRIIEVP